MVASVRLYGKHAGTLSVAPDGSLSFAYDQAWIDRIAAGDPKAHAISQSVPSTPGLHFQDEIGPFFEGLLPDNPNARAVLSRHFQIDTSDVYGLLYELGRECPGAVTIMPPEADEAVQTPIEYLELSDSEFHSMIADLPRRPLFVDDEGEIRLSLAGVHDKAAVILVGGKIAIAKGQTPTTHIIKTDIQSLPDSIKVENFCLRIAGAVGLDAVKSTIRQVGDIHYMLLARYDRTVARDHEGRPFVRRVHQEDFCQALGVYPRQKYEKDGGPDWTKMFDLLNKTADPAKYRLELLRRAHFQFLIGNPDAHAKNYSLIYKNDGLHLSKFYDLNNAAAFKAHYKRQTPRLAMSVGGERDPSQLTEDCFDQFALDVKMRTELVFDELYGLAARLLETVPTIEAQMRDTVEHSHLLAEACKDIMARCEEVLSWRMAHSCKP